MEKKDKINALAEMLINNAYDFEVENFLKSNTINEEESNDIYEQANAIVLQEKLKYLPKRNFIIFCAWTIGALISFYLFYFIIPYRDVLGYTTLLSIVGSLIVFFFIAHAFAYFGTWSVDFLKKMDRPDIQYSVFIIFLIPCFILGYILSENFDKAENEMLMASKIETRGYVLSGSTTEYKRLLRGGSGIKSSKATIQFVTKEGKEIIISKEISESDFRKFYKGLVVDLIYAKDNPRNMQLINLESLPDLPYDFDGIYER